MSVVVLQDPKQLGNIQTVANDMPLEKCRYSTFCYSKAIRDLDGRLSRWWYSHGDGRNYTVGDVTLSEAVVTICLKQTVLYKMPFQAGKNITSHQFLNYVLSLNSSVSEFKLSFCCVYIFCLKCSFQELLNVKHRSDWKSTAIMNEVLLPQLCHS